MGKHRTATTPGQLRGGNSGDIPALTGLRIIGAAWVALYHYQRVIYSAFPQAKIFKGLLAAGGNGVPLFFLLSGFIIWHNYGTSSVLTLRGLASFLWRRFARLWPVNVLMQLCAIPILWIVVHHYHYWNQPVPSWYSVHGWLANAFMVGQVGHSTALYQWDQPTWSLTGEMLAYVAFPLMAVAIIRVSMVWEGWSSLWFGLGIGIVYVLGDPQLVAIDWPRRLVMLFAGGVLLRRAGAPAVWVERLVLPWLQLAAPTLVVIVAYQHNIRWVAVLLALWVYSLANADGPGSWLFSTRPALVAGKASYSLYMFHWIAFTSSDLYVVQHPWIKHRFLAQWTTGTLAVTFVGSYLIWRFFEERSRRVLNRTFDRWWPRSAALPSLSAFRRSGERHVTPQMTPHHPQAGAYALVLDPQATHLDGTPHEMPVAVE